MLCYRKVGVVSSVGQVSCGNEFFFFIRSIVSPETPETYRSFYGRVGLYVLFQCLHVTMVTLPMKLGNLTYFMLGDLTMCYHMLENLTVERLGNLTLLKGKLGNLTLIC
jgi:hypothetical protein